MSAFINFSLPCRPTLKRFTARTYTKTPDPYACARFSVVSYIYLPFANLDTNYIFSHLSLYLCRANIYATAEANASTRCDSKVVNYDSTKVSYRFKYIFIKPITCIIPPFCRVNYGIIGNDNDVFNR